MHVRKCRAKQEKKIIQARNDMFRTKYERPFNIHRRKIQCRKLVVNGISITDDDGLRKSWKDYFATLAQSQTSRSELNQDENDIAQMETMSHGFEDSIFDSLSPRD